MIKLTQEQVCTQGLTLFSHDHHMILIWTRNTFCSIRLFGQFYPESLVDFMVL